MSDTKKLNEIETSYSKSQIYTRIEKLVDRGLMDPPDRGKQNQYLLGPRGVKALQRLEELEERHDTLNEAVATLEEEGLTEEPEKREEELEDIPEIPEEKLEAQQDRLRQFQKRWRDQLKDGIEKITELFK